MAMPELTGLITNIIETHPIKPRNAVCQLKYWNCGLKKETFCPLIPMQIHTSCCTYLKFGADVNSRAKQAKLTPA